MERNVYTAKPDQNKLEEMGPNKKESITHLHCRGSRSDFPP